MVRQFKAGHSARHVYIGEQGPDFLGLSAKYVQRIVSVRDLDNRKSGIGQRVYRHHTYQRVILGNEDENGRRGWIARGAHLRQMPRLSKGCRRYDPVSDT
jgi:hypothetical protein